MADMNSDIYFIIYMGSYSKFIFNLVISREHITRKQIYYLKLKQITIWKFIET